MFWCDYFYNISCLAFHRDGCSHNRVKSLEMRVKLLGFNLELLRGEHRSYVLRKSLFSATLVLNKVSATVHQAGEV